MAALTSACTLLPAGSKHIDLFAWNMDIDPYVLRVGDDTNDVCYRLEPDTLGRFYDATGDIGEGSTRPLRLYSALNGTLMTSLRPRTNQDVFVIRPGGGIDLVAVTIEPGSSGSSGSVFGAIPESGLDEVAVPRFAPTTHDVCDS